MDGNLLETLRHVPLLVRFGVFIAIILLVPPLCKRLRLPSVVGFLLAGIVLSPSGFRVSETNAPILNFFSEIGKLLLMFYAGLEIDLDQFRRTGGRSVVFGSLTFSIPLLTGAAVALCTGYGIVAAVLIGSLLASHTLLGFPIVLEKKLAEDEAVAVTVGATMFTDIAALLVLAVCIPIHTAGFSLNTFLLQLLGLVLYIPAVLIGLSALGKRLMGWWSESRLGQVLIMFIIIAAAGVGAKIIHLEEIVGAFLAGLAVNKAMRGSKAKEEIEFLGDLLFIPIFFISIGLLIDVNAFYETVTQNFGLVAGIVGGLIVSKLLAALATRRIYGYTRSEGLMMWSLSMPQVAATLAAALVAFEAKNRLGVGLIDGKMIDTVIVLLLVTSILGPILTEVYCKKIAAAGTGARAAATL